MEIRELTEADVAAYWPLRLRALREEPEAFGSSYEDSKDRPVEQIAGQFKEIADAGGCTLGAFAAGQLVGMVILARHTGTKIRHVGDIFAMYVAPEVRGQHVGRLLMEATIAHARSSAGLEQLHLAVVTTQTPARSLYRSLGFQSFGVMPHALKLPDGRYLDENLMLLWLHGEP